jgi:uncharacterized protein (UPF0332 family)
MPHDDLFELAWYRLDNAKTLLKTARAILDLGDYKSVANRSYYAILNAMRACLAPLGKDYKKHSSVISDFRLFFLKNEKLEKNLSIIISGLFDVRTKSDYNDFYIISKAEVTTQLENAELFVQKIEIFMQQNYSENNG